MNNYLPTLKQIEQKLVADTKKIREIKELVDSFQEYEKILQMLKDDIKIKKSNEDVLEEATAKTKILEPLNIFYRTYLESYNAFMQSQTAKETYDFFERYRTYRTYQLNENILERFISGFLNNFAEDFTFKTEFIGQINTANFAQAVGGVKDGSLIKIKYNQIPKTIKEAYNLRLKKFIIESHNLKLLFRENYLVEIYGSSGMIYKTDRLAKENNISCL
ncbi:MAG: hypothetical protein COT14_03835 [Candidatus Diapherotrites archaeon CG08_land_8_20_14_0_20_30_16]|nr:MAG: hypothetical protein COT14_03835 [Candidatus Diapherotrites archaeon CG08_land_8_20_14_0_20_30_16]